MSKIDNENHADYSPSQSMIYEDQIIPESDYIMPEPQPIETSKQPSLQSTKMSRFGSSGSLKKSTSQGGLMSSASLMKTPFTIK